MTKTYKEIPLTKGEDCEDEVLTALRDNLTVSGLDIVQKLRDLALELSKIIRPGCGLAITVSKNDDGEKLSIRVIGLEW